MRAEDWNMAIALRNHWQGLETPGVTLCPLLADLDRLLVYLDDKSVTPGDAIFTCPECGEYHRWALLSDLMFYALDIAPARHSSLLETIDKRLAEERKLYGGKEGYKKMRKEAEEYFAKIGAGHNYTIR